MTSRASPPPPAWTMSLSPLTVLETRVPSPASPELRSTGLGTSRQRHDR